MTLEIWKPVVGYEGLYEVSSLGQVKSLPRVDRAGRHNAGRVMAIINHPSGHVHVKLSRNGVYRNPSIHRLVAIAFFGQPQPGLEVCHNDGNPANNNVSNLRWGTRSENLYDRVRHGTHHMARKTHCPHGHPYSEENTYRTKDGRRMCIECLRAQGRRVKEQKVKAKS